MPTVERKFFLFGAPRIELNGQSITLRRTKALALLAYLAITRQPQERETLLGLLWPEFDESSARNNLRRELSLLRDAVGGDLLQSGGQQIGLSARASLWLDVGSFQHWLAEAQGLPPDSAAQAEALTAAVELAGAEFMAGFSLPESPRFEEWQFFQREALRQQLGDALAALGAWHRASGNYGMAIDLARRWLALDQLHEPAQRMLIELYARAGQQAAALRQYEGFRRLLIAELGIEPEEATHELAALVKSRQLASNPVTRAPAAPDAAPAERSSSPGVEPPPGVAPAPVLPPLSAGFVGRTRELADIVRRLTDPDCRLLTLAGPGGVGKTQLALQVAHTLLDGLAGGELLADGVAFVNLLPVVAPEGLLVALADALRFTPAQGRPLPEQLFAYLRARRMLLVLDNCEQLLEASSLLTALLAAAPGVRLLVTSRVALNLQEEWFHPLDGLAFPPADSVAVADLARYDAVRLFEQLARRARSDFQLSGALRPVVQLCRLVSGMPLALELAAGWLKSLTVEQVVAAIERSPDTLSSRDRSLPERHRTMRAIFETTWRRLMVDEQAGLVGMTVFVGEFGAEAAQAVAGVGLGVLASLVEHSLVRPTSGGRFQLHELLRQFAADELPEVAAAARERHATYFLNLAAADEFELAALGNLRAAWLWALAERRYELLDRALASVAALFRGHGSYAEAESLFAHTVASTSEAPGEAASRVGARALIQQAAACYRLGDKAGAMLMVERGLDQLGEDGPAADRIYAALLAGSIRGWQGDEATARRHLEEGLWMAQQLGIQDLVLQARLSLSWLCNSYGAYSEGLEFAEASLADARAAGDTERTASAQRMVACAAAYSGNYVLAELHLRQSLELSEAGGSRSAVAASLNGLGWTIWCGGGSRDEAAALQSRCLELRRAVGDLTGVTMALNDLALVVLDLGEYGRARRLCEEGLAIANRIDNPTFRAQHLAILGHIATHEDAHAAARAHLSEALRCALEHRLWPQVAFALFYAALLLLREADREGRAHEAASADSTALQLLAAVISHPATWQIYRSRAEQHLKALRRHLPEALADDAIARGHALDWQTELHRFVAELAEAAWLPRTA